MPFLPSQARETSGNISSWKWDDTNGGNLKLKVKTDILKQVACGTSQITTEKQSSFLPPCIANLVLCYSCSFLLLNNYVLPAVITVTGSLWSILWRSTECCDCTGDIQIQLASAFAWTLTNAGRNDIGVKTKQNKTTSGNFSSCGWLASLTPKGGIVKSAIPQRCAVLEMLNCKGKTAQC